MSLSVSDDQTVWPQKNAEFYNYDLGLCELAFAMEVDESAQHGSILFYRTCDPVVTTPHPTFDIRQKTNFEYCRPKAERGSTEARFDEQGSPQATYLHALDVFQGPAICSDGIQVTEIIDADFHSAKCGLRKPLRRPPI